MGRLTTGKPSRTLVLPVVVDAFGVDWLFRTRGTRVEVTATPATDVEGAKDKAVPKVGKSEVEDDNIVGAEIIRLTLPRAVLNALVCTRCSRRSASTRSSSNQAAYSSSFLEMRAADVS